ncbi:hypothetical protein ABPG74_020946 [Tetrahymena malaccensis]
MKRQEIYNSIDNQLLNEGQQSQLSHQFQLDQERGNRQCIDNQMSNSQNQIEQISDNNNQLINDFKIEEVKIQNGNNINNNNYCLNDNQVNQQQNNQYSFNQLNNALQVIDNNQQCLVKNNEINQQENRISENSQQQNFDTQRILVAPKQIETSVKALTQNSQQFQTQFQNLIEIQKYFPNQSISDQYYNENIKNLYQVINQLISWPSKFQNVQNQFQILLQKFSRLQSQIAFQIHSHFKINYKLETKHLGNYIEDNKQIVQKFDELKGMLQQTYDEIKKHDLYQYQANILTSLKSVFATVLNQDQSKQIYKIKQDYNLLQSEKHSEIQALTKKYGEVQMETMKLRNQQTYIQQEIQQLQKYADQKESEIVQISQQLKLEKSEQKKYFEDYIQKINTRRQQLQNQLIQNQNEENEKQITFIKKQQNEIEKITNQCSILQKSQLQSPKSNFHFIFILDQSSSFQSVYNTAVKALINYTDNINTNDSLSVIQFNVSASQIFSQQANPKINKINLNLALQNYRFGGTSFAAAFNQLKTTIQKQVKQNEFPIVLFITDGQDSIDQSIKIQDVLNQTEDLIFFTLGYGSSINERQLKLITNLFNRTVNETKIINKKQIQLFYQNNTPDQLYRDILKISQMQMTIEEVEQSRQYITKSIKFQSEQFTEFSNQINDQIRKQIKDLNDQEIQLKQQQSTQQQYQQFEKIIQQLKQEKNKIIQKIQQNEIKIQKTQQEITQLNSLYYNQFYNQGSESFNQAADDEQQFKKNFDKKINETIKRYDDQLEAKQKDMIKCSETEREIIKNNQQFLKDLGFHNQSQFDKFFDYLQKITSVQMQSNDVIHQYNLIIESLIDISTNLEQNINFSLDNIGNISKTDTEGRILEYYQQLDESISLKEKAESRQKVLRIQNSSIIENCKKQNKMKLYEDCINTIEFPDIQELVELERQAQEKKIEDLIYSKFIQKDQKLSLAEGQKKQLAAQINEVEEKIQEEQNKNDSDIKKETNIQKLQTKLETLKERQETNKDKIDNLAVEFKSKTYEDAKIVKQIITAFVQATHSAQVQLKYQFALKPYQYFIQTIQNVIQQINKFQNPQLVQYNNLQLPNYKSNQIQQLSLTNQQ